MLTDQQKKECGLSNEQIKQMEDDVVEQHRKLYLDEALWETLLELYRQELEIKSTLCLYYRLAHQGHDRKFFQRVWMRQVNRLNSSIRLMEGYIWHLTKRYDPDIEHWLAQREEHERANRINWANAGAF
jgi:hypothetical protein